MSEDITIGNTRGNMLKIKKKKPLIYYWIKFIFSPEYWLFNSDYNKGWDDTILKILEDPKIERLDSHYITINGKTLWIANWPYAALVGKVETDTKATWRNSKVGKECRPSTMTLMKFDEMMKGEVDGRKYPK